MARGRLYRAHIDGTAPLRVQLKGRLAFYKKYQGKKLWIAFNEGETWYLFPHDKLLSQVLKTTSMGSTVEWSNRGRFSFPRLSKQLRKLLLGYRITGDVRPVR